MIRVQQVVRATNPALLSLRGAGPVTSATLLVARIQSLLTLGFGENLVC